jgi:hypothetical protein
MNAIRVGILGRKASSRILRLKALRNRQIKNFIVLNIVGRLDSDVTDGRREATFPARQ